MKLNDEQVSQLRQQMHSLVDEQVDAMIEYYNNMLNVLPPNMDDVTKSAIINASVSEICAATQRATKTQVDALKANMNKPEFKQHIVDELSKQFENKKEESNGK